MADDEAREELNRLYWESDASVAEIADRLDISRRALYDGIEPRPAGAPCPDCGGALGFRNRTGAANREAECAACGGEVSLSGDRPAPEPAPTVEQERRAGPLSPTRRAATSGSGPALAIMLLFGIGLGAAIGYFFRRG